MTKTEARAQARAAWRGFPPDALRAMGARMCRTLFDLPVWRQAHTVLCYLPLPGEPGLDAVVGQALSEGKCLAAPRVVGGGYMEWPLLRRAGDWVPGAYGIREPQGNALFDPALADGTVLALVPCLACDKKGVRLGRGGGYYDRFLAQYKGKRLLVCPRALVWDELPRDPWDACFAPDELLTDD